MSADLSCPVCGTELDLTVLFAHEGDQRALARLAKDSRIVEVEAGHALMSEAPGPVLDALRAFLRR